MLTIRLQRRGRTNDPVFRVIVVDSKRAAKTGSALETLGSYDARTDRVELNVERIKHWLKEGAQASDTVHNMLISQKIIEGKKINVLPRKSPPAKEGGESAGEASMSAEPAAPAEASAPEEVAVEDKSVAEETPAA